MKLINDRFEHEAGTEVYAYKGHTYGLVEDDTAGTGIIHTAVTLNSDGSTPFFTVAIDDLSE